MLTDVPTLMLTDVQTPFFRDPLAPGLHNKIPAHKIFARVWVAQKSFFS